MLDEHVDPEYEPTRKEIDEYAEWLGMDLQKDQDLFWIARTGLKAPLPKPWKPCQSEDSEIFYFNSVTGESVWDHPCDDHYRKLYQEHKAQKEGRPFNPDDFKNDKNKKDKKDKKRKGSKDFSVESCDTGYGVPKMDLPKPGESLFGKKGSKLVFDCKPKAKAEASAMGGGSTPPYNMSKAPEKDMPASVSDRVGQDARAESTSVDSAATSAFYKEQATDLSRLEREHRAELERLRAEHDSKKATVTRELEASLTKDMNTRRVDMERTLTADMERNSRARVQREVDDRMHQWATDYEASEKDQARRRIDAAVEGGKAKLEKERQEARQRDVEVTVTERLRPWEADLERDRRAAAERDVEGRVRGHSDELFRRRSAEVEREVEDRVSSSMPERERACRERMDHDLENKLRPLVAAAEPAKRAQLEAELEAKLRGERDELERAGRAKIARDVDEKLRPEIEEVERQKREQIERERQDIASRGSSGGAALGGDNAARILELEESLSAEKAKVVSITAQGERRLEELQEAKKAHAEELARAKSAHEVEMSRAKSASEDDFASSLQKASALTGEGRAELQRKVVELEASLRDHERSGKDKEAEAEKLRTESANARKELEESRRTESERRDELERLRASSSSGQQDMGKDAELERLRLELESLRKQLTEAKQLAEARSAEVQCLRSAHDARAKDGNTREAEVERLRRELDALRKHEAEAERLRHELESIKRELANAKRADAEGREELERLRASYAKAQEGNGKEVELEHLQQEMEFVQKQLGDARRAESEGVAEQDRLRSSSLKALELLRLCFQSESLDAPSTDEFTNDLPSLKAIVSDVMAQRQKLGANEADLDKAVEEAAFSKHRTAELESTVGLKERELSRWKSQCEEEENKARKLALQSAEASGQSDEQRRSVENLSNLLETELQRSRSLEEERQRCLDQEAAARQRLAAAEAAATAAATAASTAQLRHQREASSDVERLRGEIATLQQQLASLRVEAERARANEERLRIEAREHEESERRERQRLASTAADAARSGEQLRAERDHLQRRVELQQEEAERLRHSHNEVEAERARLLAAVPAAQLEQERLQNALKDERATMERTRSALQGEVDQLRRMHGLAEADAERVRSSSSVAEASSVALARQETERYRSRCDELERQAASAATQAAAAAADALRRADEPSAAAKVASAQVAAAHAAASDARRELDGATREIAERDAAVVRMRGELSLREHRAGAEVAAARAEAAVAKQTSASEASEEIVTLRSQLQLHRSATAEVGLLRAELQGFRDLSELSAAQLSPGDVSDASPVADGRASARTRALQAELQEQRLVCAVFRNDASTLRVELQERHRVADERLRFVRSELQQQEQAKERESGVRFDSFEQEAARTRAGDRAELSRVRGELQAVRSAALLAEEGAQLQEQRAKRLIADSTTDRMHVEEKIGRLRAEVQRLERELDETASTARRDTRKHDDARARIEEELWSAKRQVSTRDSELADFKAALNMQTQRGEGRDSHLATEAFELEERLRALDRTDWQLQEASRTLHSRERTVELDAERIAHEHRGLAELRATLQDAKMVYSRSSRTGRPGSLTARSPGPRKHGRARDAMQLPMSARVANDRAFHDHIAAFGQPSAHTYPGAFHAGEHGAEHDRAESTLLFGNFGDGLEVDPADATGESLANIADDLDLPEANTGVPRDLLGIVRMQRERLRRERAFLQAGGAGDQRHSPAETPAALEARAWRVGEELRETRAVEKFLLSWSKSASVAPVSAALSAAHAGDACDSSAPWAAAREPLSARAAAAPTLTEPSQCKYFHGANVANIVSCGGYPGRATAVSSAMTPRTVRGVLDEHERWVRHFRSSSAAAGTGGAHARRI